MMISLVISGIVNAIAALVIGLAAYLRNPKSTMYRTFALMNLVVAMWSIFYALWLSSSTADNALLFTRLLAFFSTLIPIFFLHWVLSLLGKNNRLLLLYGYLATVFLLISSLTPYYVLEVKPRLFFPFWPTGGLLYGAYVLLYLTLTGYAVYSLISELSNTSGHKKGQIRYAIIGSIIGFVGGASNFFLWFDIGIPPYGNFLVWSYVLLFGYAMLRYRLMDIRLLVLKSVAYSLSFALVVLGYVSITIYVFKILETIINPIALNVFIIFMLLFTFDPLRRFIEKNTNKLFAKNRYNPEVLWRVLDEINITFGRQEDLTKRWLDTITEQMNISRAAFLLLGSPVRYIQNVNFAEKTKKEWQELAEVALNSNKTVVYDELVEGSIDREAMHRFNAEILIPVKKKNQVLGILVLGEKNSGDIYSVQDISFLEDFANRAAVALERSKEIKAKEKEIFKIKALYNQAEKSVSGVSLDYVLNTTIDTAFMATDSDGGSIMLLDKNGQLVIRASRGIPSEFGVQSIGIGDGIAGRVALTRKPLIVDDRDPELATLLKREQIKSAMCVPMEVGGRLIGILSVNRIYNNRPFTDHDLELVCTVAANIAHRIENTKLIQEERKRHKEVINIYAAATEARDPYTFGHSETVTLYAGAIARAMGLSKGHLNIIENAAILHDIGKIGIPDHILNKPGRLTKDEFNNIRQHPIIGERLIRQYSNLEDVAPLALHHHERFDGKGYPDQIKGREIPLGARILAVADAFDAMTSDRPYKPALSLGQAKKELAIQSGGQFDPKVAEAFLELLDDNFFSESQAKKQLSKLTRLHH